MHRVSCTLLLFWYWRCFQYPEATAPCLLPSPLLVICSDPQTHFRQQQNSTVRTSCLWDGDPKLYCLRVSGFVSRIRRGCTDFPSSDCSWCWRSAWMRSTILRQCRWLLGFCLKTHPPWDSSRIPIQGASISCRVPTCLHHDLSTEVFGQDIQLLLLQPLTCPASKQKPVLLGWCARLNSSRWPSHHSGQGGEPVVLLLPASYRPDSPHHHNGKLYNTCISYFSYHPKVHDTHQGLHVASLHTDHGPQDSLSLDLLVEPILVHLFSIHSKWLAITHSTINLFWSLLRVSPRKMAYRLLDVESGFWSTSYSPYVLKNNFSVGRIPQHSRKKVVASIYFCTEEGETGELRGELGYSNATLSLTSKSEPPFHFTLNTSKIKMGTYLFSPARGLYYSTQEGKTPDDPSSMHYFFYQQQTLSYLFTIEFHQWQWYRLSMHTYLNRKGIPLQKFFPEKNIEVHVFNSGPSFLQSLIYIVWFVPIQHPLLQNEWTFELQLFDSRGDFLLRNNTYTYRDRIKNAAHFIPHFVLPFNPALYAGFVAPVNCTKRLIRAVLKTTINPYASKESNFTVPCLQNDCFIKHVKIRKPDSSNSVLQYSKGTSFTLSADIQMNCPSSKHRGNIWKIYKVSDVKATPDWSKPFDPPGLGRQDLVMLDVPGSTFDDGLYLFNFTVKLTTTGTSETVEDSDSVFVQVGSGSLVAIIAGGNFRTVGFSDQWTLDGSYSYDTEAALPSERITFTWYCTKQKSDYASMTLSLKGKCHPDQVNLKWTTSSNEVQTVQPETLQANIIYYFCLAVQKGGRIARAEQTVHVQPSSVPILNITCIENCGPSVTPRERLCLSGKCMNCGKSIRLLYHWSLLTANFTEINFDWDAKTTTGRSSPYMCIKTLSFLNMTEATYVLTLKASIWRYQSSVYNYSFFVNSPPQIGKCLLKPTTGSVFLTKFIVHCSGFRDKHLPLTYKVKAASHPLTITKVFSIENNTPGTIVYSGYRSKIPPSFLPIGIPSKQYTLTIHIEAYDALGAFSQVTLQAKVHGPFIGKQTDYILNELHGLSSGPKAPISYFLESGDYFNAGYFVYMVASVLNSIEALQQFHSSKTELREILLNKSAEIPTTGILELTQMVSGISQITQEAAEVNRKTQLLALRKLKELSKELKRYRDKNLGSRDIEVLSTGIFEGLSNILKASLLDYRNVHKNGVTDTLSITEILAEIILQGKVPGENETVMETSDWTIRFRKDAKWSVPGTFPHRGVCKNCFYSKINQEGHDELPADAEVSTVVFAFHKNPFPWLPFSKDISTTVTGFKMTGTRSDGNIVGVIPDVAEMIMTRKDEGPAIFELNIGHNRKLHKKTGGFSFEVHRNSKEVFIQIVTERKLTFQLFVYLGLNINHPPIASFSGSHNKHTATTGKKSKGHGCAAQDSSIFCLSRSLLKSMFQGNSAEKWNMSIILQSDPFLWDPRVQVVGVRLFTADCLYLDGIQSQWKEGVCDLGPQTSWEKLHCICKAKQRTPRTASPRPRRTSKNDMKFLAGKVSVHPDLKEVPLVRVNNNPVTTVTVLFIFVVYICLAVWTMRKDRADVKSVDHIIVLSDNDPYDQVCYFVTIYTGSRFGAGTTADVFIQLIGHRDASDIHCLRHPEYPVLVRGAVNTFLLTSKNDLGDIYSFRAWHNHGGSSPNWFLSRVKVQNVFTKQSWKFICRKWFALNKDDGLIERSFVATHPTTPLSKMDFFWINLACELAETHLWLSVFAHISTSSLKRLHRLSSCLAMLLCTLLFNIIFFSANKDELVASQQPLYLRSLLTGIHSAFIFFPLQILITVLFKYSQQKPLQQGPFNTQHQGRSAFMSRNLRNWKERLQKWYLAETASKGLGDSFHKSLSRTPDSYGLEQLKRKSWGQAAKKQSNCTVSEGDANIIATEEDMVHDAQAPNNFNNRHEKKDPFPQVTPLNSPIVLSNKNPQIIIPWWYAYVLWTLVLVTSTVSSFFIIFYGLSYDYETSFEWLIASSVSFCESVFLLQTLNVAFFSALRTLYPKYCDNIPWSKRETYLEIKLDNKTMDADEMRELHYELVRLRGTKQYQPLEEDEVALLKKKQKVEQQAFVFIKGIICHFVFLILILSIAYSMENTASFYYNQDIHNKFSQGLSDISKPEHIYSWLKNVFLHLIHNKNYPSYLSKSWSKILGLPRMRQIRATNTSKDCFHPRSLVNLFVISNSHCLHHYGHDPEDQRDYHGSWTNSANESIFNPFSNFSGYTYYSVPEQWKYTSYGTLHAYGAGGYTFHFHPEEQQSNSSRRVAFLKQRGWLDENTWALIVELTAFNPDADLFCSISVVFEMSDLGPVNTSLSIHSYKLPLFKQLSKTQKFVFVTVAYILIFYIADEICVVQQQRLRYVRNVSNLINFGIKTVCLFYLLNHSFKFKLASSLIQLYLLHPKEFIPFHKVSHIDQTIRVALGFLIFLIILKTLRYSRFFYDVRLAQRSILAALPGICSMALVVAVYFFVYMAFGYLVFGQYEWNYNTMIHSAQTVFSYCVSAFKDTAFTSNRILGSLYLSSFMMVMICVLINLFQAVIMSSYEDMKQPVYEEPSEEAEVVKFLCHKIRKIWFLIRCKTPPEHDAELFIRFLYGHSERRNSRHLGLKARKINGRKMVYLVV
ncbi:polycystic kidney disease and receptor for egg jelly-related protein-like [Sphaerodactylus townsendi]|uniref:polycystic kidney disease and receptor for egg jelly-related protein-like n=1 Tax=Sphaerodactylus townsendi TaxID=933632 RepID=UPI0020274DA1|nr:polycystic kidney disease and receptor for egg jelly-related protein-like [Sphaerodactylus townsendi]